MGRKAANHSFCGATFAVCFPKSAFTPNEFSPFFFKQIMQYSLSKPVSDERNRRLPLQVVSLSAHAQIPL